jgi:hypothetical protein
MGEAMHLTKWLAVGTCKMAASKRVAPHPHPSQVSLVGTGRFTGWMVPPWADADGALPMSSTSSPTAGTTSLLLAILLPWV